MSGDLTGLCLYISRNVVRAWYVILFKFYKRLFKRTTKTGGSRSERLNQSAEMTFTINAEKQIFAI